jgi:hypothetical protein
MKVRIRAIIFLILILAITVLLSGLFTNFLGPPLIELPPGLGIIREKTVSDSEIILKEMRDIFQFQTVEFIRKVVFPHDFIPSGISLASLMETLREGEGSIETLLSDDKLQYLAVYDMAQKIGIDIEAEPFEFLVASVTIRAGFKLSGTALASDSLPDDSELAEWIKIETKKTARESEDPVKTIRIKLPPIAITDIIIEDDTSETYNYPDIDLSPEQWRELSAYIAGELRGKVLEEGVLEHAEKNAIEFIGNFLKTAGYDKVIFF